jgi:uncharacterized repeat protein (TIGR02543 family)
MNPRKLGCSALRPVLGILAMLSLVLAAFPGTAGAASPTVVISQVYGGGGNAGSVYTNDFIELHNRSDVAVPVGGWSLQYASSAGTSWSATPLSGTIPPGGYYLVQEAAGSGGTTALPTPDATGSLAMSATSAKVALVSSTTALTGACPSGGGIVDLFGYGAASCSETTPLAALTNTTAALRGNDGCLDTDVNSSDFASGAPAPRNSASATRSCQYLLDATANPLAGGGIGKAPDQPAYLDGSIVQLTATPSIGYHFVNWSGDASGAANPVNVTMGADRSVIADFALDTYTLAVTVVGSGSVAKSPDQPDYDYGASVSLTATAATGWHFVGWSGDASGSTNPLPVTMDADKSITATFDENDVVVSQVYGGGGNAGATYTNDFVELFNHGSSAVDVTGWTVQYATASGTSWSGTPLTGSIPPGGYYLVQEAQGAGGSTSLPTPDATGSIAMSATAGKVALVNGGTALVGACPGGPTIEDLVGYGAADCSETAPTDPPNNAEAALRNGDGCEDSGNNSADFTIAMPSPRNSASAANPCHRALTITVAPAGGGSVAKSPDQPTYPHGSTVQLTATPATGYHFVAWSGDATGNANPLDVTMNADKSITAHFSTNQPAGGIVISQIYGGGGNIGSSYRQDFVELFNYGNQPVDVTAWSVQYASASGGTWSTTPLFGTIQPGQYYLVKEDEGASGTSDVPTPDAIGTIALHASDGKVALVSNTVPLSGDCPGDASIVDLVGYGASDCFQVAPAPGLDNVTAALRNSEGCSHLGNNATDFSSGSPSPRNSASPLHTCSEWLGVGPDAVTDLVLAPVAPNPTHGGSRVTYALPREASVSLRVLDLQGRLVATLVDGVMPAGRHDVLWGGETRGGAARSGLYFVRLEAEGKRLVRSVAVLR